MKLKFCFMLLSLASISFAEGASRNLCDDLVDSGTSSKADIDQCLEQFGRSRHYNDMEAKNQKKEELDKIKTGEASSLKKNLEIKVFSSEELSKKGFGKAFYAIRGDYRNNRYEEKRLTDGDALCTYLGYEKAIKSTVSPEIYENKNGAKVDQEGLFFDTNIFGMVSKTPEIYRDKDFKFTVRKYVEIVCIKRKDKSLEGSGDTIKVVTEDLIKLNDGLNAKTGDNQNSGINNGARSTSEKEGKTPYGYTQPEWTKTQSK